MSKAHTGTNSDGTKILLFFCPGCQETHGCDIRPGKNPLTGAAWEWNGSLDKPTLSPSVNVRSSGPKRCHSYVRDGKIEFLSDSQHELRGQIVDLPDWDSR